MKPRFNISLCCLILLVLFSPASALERLSTSQLKSTMGQGGISIGISDVKLESHTDALTISNPEDDSQFISFDGCHSVTTFSNSLSDLTGNGVIGCLTLDVGTVPDPINTGDYKPYIFLISEDWDMTHDLTIDTINVCGTDIGSLAIDNLSMPSFHLFLGAHDSCGIDAEFGARISIDQFSFGTDATDTLALSGIHFASSFTDNPLDAPSDPGTWSSTGEFTLGDITSGTQMTFDIASDNTEAWEFTDIDGVSYTATNPRAGGGFIALNAPMQGSVRIENISFGGNDLGSFALDNIQAHKLYIEIPGRGLGTP